MFTPIKRKSKLLGTPWCSSHYGRRWWHVKADPAWWINTIADNLAWYTGFTHLYNALEARWSWWRDGDLKCPENYKDKNIFGYTRDWWRRTGGDRTCSYCGSMHPDDFEKFLRRVIWDMDRTVRISLADGGSKVYLSRPGVVNAACGAVKFYGYHAPRGCDGKVSEDHFNLLKDALRVSNEKFEAAMSRKTA